MPPTGRPYLLIRRRAKAASRPEQWIGIGKRKGGRGAGGEGKGVLHV